MSIEIKQGEAKDVTFIVKDEDGNSIDCSTATCTFDVKINKGDTTKIITKADDVFDKTNAATGILIINITATDSDIQSLVYLSQLTIQFTETDIIKSKNIDFIVEEDL